MLVLFLCGILLLLFHVREVQKHIAIEENLTCQIKTHESMRDFTFIQCARMIDERDLYILFLENEPRSKK